MKRFATLAVCLLALAGCGNSSSSNTSTTSTSAIPSTTAAPTTTAVAGIVTACVTTDLVISATNSDAGAGQRYITLALKNTSQNVCTLQGYPTVAIYNGTTALVTNSSPQPGSTNAVSLNPNASAAFDLHYSVVGSAANEKCPAATRLAVTPPNQTAQLSLPLTNITIASICPSSGATVTPLRAA